MKVKSLLRSAVLLLALTLCLSLLGGCSSKGKTLMTLEKDGVSVSLSVNTYELMLSRIKGTLCFLKTSAGGFTADQDKFWDYIERMEGRPTETLDSFYRSQVLENCKSYLVGLYLFESMGLSLPASTEAAVDDQLGELLLTDADGSKNKLNQILSAYGVNYELLREAYLMSAKVELVQKELYGENASLIGDNIKMEYLEENYVHFHQYFLEAYHYRYETDVNGDVIYYHTETEQIEHIYYDVHTGFTKTDSEGNPLTDKKGDVIYYTDATCKKIAYNTTYGAPRATVSEDGIYQTKPMTPEELDAVKKKADETFASLQGLSPDEFEAEIEKKQGELIKQGIKNELYADGYYLRTDTDYLAGGEEYEYLQTIVDALQTMEDGQMMMVKSSVGYHILMKYAPTEKAYANAENEVWFSNFNSSLVEKMFFELCETHYADIVIDEKVLASVPSMKKIGINYYY